MFQASVRASLEHCSETEVFTVTLETWTHISKTPTTVIAWNGDSVIMTRVPVWLLRKLIKLVVSKERQQDVWPETD